MNVLILEVDAERRRLSLSLKRVDEAAQPKPRADGGESVHATPNLDLSEEVFADEPAAVATEEPAEEAEEPAEPSLEAEPPADEPRADEPPADEPPADEPPAEEE